MRLRSDCPCAATGRSDPVGGAPLNYSVSLSLSASAVAKRLPVDLRPPRNFDAAEVSLRLCPMARKSEGIWRFAALSQDCSFSQMFDSYWSSPAVSVGRFRVSCFAGGGAKPRPRPGTDDRPASKDGAMRCPAQRAKETRRRTRTSWRREPSYRALPGNFSSGLYPAPEKTGAGDGSDCSITFVAFDRLRSAPRETGTASSAQRPAARSTATRIAARRGPACRSWTRSASRRSKADIPYAIVSRRYQRPSTLTATSLGFARRDRVFPRASGIAGTVDRLIDNATLAAYEMKPNSAYRVAVDAIKHMPFESIAAGPKLRPRPWGLDPRAASRSSSQGCATKAAGSTSNPLMPTKAEPLSTSCPGAGSPLPTSAPGSESTPTMCATSAASGARRRRTRAGVARRTRHQAGDARNLSPANPPRPQRPRPVRPPQPVRPPRRDRRRTCRPSP